MHVVVRVCNQILFGFLRQFRGFSIRRLYIGLFALWGLEYALVGRVLRLKKFSFARLGGIIALP
jgi:hypothetical protein